MSIDASSSSFFCCFFAERSAAGHIHSGVTEQRRVHASVRALLVIPCRGYKSGVCVRACMCGCHSHVRLDVFISAGSLQRKAVLNISTVEMLLD